MFFIIKESKPDSWSFDKAINEVFMLLSKEMCAKTSQDLSPSKPLSGIEFVIESRTAALPLLAHSKRIGNTVKSIRNN